MKSESAYDYAPMTAKSPGAIARFEEKISYLADRVELLEHRLSPIMRPSNPPTPMTTVNPDSGSALGDLVNTLSFHVSRIELILDRLDL